MTTNLLSLVNVRRPARVAVRLVCLGALLGGAVVLSAEDAAPVAEPAPLLDKPLPPSTPDTVGEQPSAQHVYICGHWRWQDGAYVWDSGHWEMPPTADATWVAPKWEQKDAGYVLVEGYWQQGGAGAEVAAGDASAEVVEEAPPPPEREIIVERPAPDYVWIGGYWTWRGGRHVWVGGRWDRPPRAGVAWVSPRWVRRGHGYVFVPGCWEDRPVRPRTAVVIEGDGWRSNGVVTFAPPPPRFEHRTPRPGYEFVWIDGYWGWQGGRYVWIGGRWDRPPHGRHHWRAPRWEHRHGGYLFVEGRWD